MPDKLQKKKKQISILEKSIKSDKLKNNEYVRIQAVLLNLKGFTHKQISKITLKSADALEKWVTKFNKQGIQGLKNKPLSKPRNYKLNWEQKNEIKKIVVKNIPEQLSFQGEFWNPHSLKQLIKKQFNVTYKTRKAYTELLKYCGFSYQKVEYKDSREDKEYKKHMKLRLQKKLKKGVLRMYW
ncbi:MAG: helix-turn-helix domain-containing protein [Nanoarchaeota archaeon]|nr:helix-turn-helix domain-containing protein [Nanoarchaeota archaeon]